MDEENERETGVSNRSEKQRSIRNEKQERETWVKITVAETNRNKKQG